uniref:Large ribosomal subunit protein uL2 RNA-binding domain-containing protein n=1 Tax=Timema cristinae TaxID=61476 RepID=A0A7R9DDK0_TIMCR|nr:unnamed protein product [Timema cristinae]
MAPETSLKFSVRFKCRDVNVPKPGGGRSFRRIVHFPEEYTVKPLSVTNLAGRDPVSGRVVAQGIGGGIKHKYHWIDWIRDGPKEGPPILEEVIEVMNDGCRTTDVALVAVGKKLKYILATENMKPGDVLKTSRHIPRIPVRANEGDAYPLGALQIGTKVHCIEKYEGTGGLYIHAAEYRSSLNASRPVPSCVRHLRYNDVYSESDSETDVLPPDEESWSESSTASLKEDNEHHYPKPGVYVMVHRVVVHHQISLKEEPLLQHQEVTAGPDGWVVGLTVEGILSDVLSIL